MSEILIGRCGRTQEGQIRINKKSDFPLSLKLVKDGNFIKWYDCDFDIKAFVEDGLTAYTAGRSGGVYNHCRLEEDGSLTLFFDNHNLSVGELQIEVVFHHPDNNYGTDGVRQEAFTVASNVYLVNDNGNAVSLEMPAPQIVEKEVIREVEKEVIKEGSNALQTLLSGVENTGLTEQVLKGMIVEKKYESNENIFNSPFEEGEKEALIEYRKYLALNPKYSREGLFKRLTADNLEVVLYGQDFARMFTNANIKHLTLSFKGSPSRFSDIFSYTNGETLEVKIGVGAYPNNELRELFAEAKTIGEQFGTSLKKLIVTICKDKKTPFEQGEYEISWHYYGFRNNTFKYWDLLPSLGLGGKNLRGKIEFDTNVILSPEGWNKIQELGYVISESKKYSGPVMEDFSL